MSVLVVARAASEGTVEQGGGRVKRDARRVGRVQVGDAPCASRVSNRVDGREYETLALVLDPGWRVGLGERARDSNEAAGEKAKRGLPVLSLHGEGVVASDAPARADRERVDEALLVEGVGRTRGGGEDVGGRLAHEGRVRGSVVVLV